MKRYQCHGKLSWNGRELHLFDYRINSDIAPLAGDTILISEEDMEENGLTSTEWIILGRRWREGVLELVIEPKGDGLVLA